MLIYYAGWQKPSAIPYIHSLKRWTMSKWQFDGKVALHRRKALKMTQMELAKKSGLNHQTICTLETGYYSPKAETICKLAEALDIDPCLFFKET